MLVLRPGAAVLEGRLERDQRSAGLELALAVSGDARAVARRIEEATGIVGFVPVSDAFLPAGDQHGLLILTDVERTLLPTESTRVADAPVEVLLRGPREATVRPTEQSVVVAVAGGPAYRGPSAT